MADRVDFVDRIDKPVNTVNKVNHVQNQKRHMVGAACKPPLQFPTVNR